MGRMEILTGREHRRIWSDKQKLDILADVASSGQSIVEVARRHDIVPQQIYSWRKQMRQEPTEARTDVTFLCGFRIKGTSVPVNPGQSVH
ncbi:transposase [Phyllobacterium zundukense]|uniref:transposase n=1 Tax=Phyllobacterium zundukense TaxID=1867719 RepID=UPI003965B39E